jgi:hypothetical protein
MPYSTAVADSWKEQLLLNIVKTRYGDTPAFMEVVSVVSGYTLETGVGVEGQFSPESLRSDTFAAASVGQVHGSSDHQLIADERRKVRPQPDGPGTRRERNADAFAKAHAAHLGRRRSDSTGTSEGRQCQFGRDNPVAGRLHRALQEG